MEIEKGYIDLPSPFGLAKPTAGWLQAVLSYDAELVVFPSQKQAVYRLCRRTKHAEGVTAQVFKMAGVPPDFQPDTQVMVHFNLVPVFSIPPKCPAEEVVKKLWARDQWAFKNGDAVADHMDARDEQQQIEDREAWKKEARYRHRQSRISYLYRTGRRISLVSPRRRAPASAAATDSPPAPALSPDATSAPATEV